MTIDTMLGVSNAETGISVMDAKEDRFRNRGWRSSRSEETVSEVPVVNHQNRTIASHNL